jgi:hypothetical protein
MYSSVPPDKYQDNTSNVAITTSFQILSNIWWPKILPFDI